MVKKQQLISVNLTNVNLTKKAHSTEIGKGEKNLTAKRLLQLENKTAIIIKINENKDILFGAFSDRIIKENKLKRHGESLKKKVYQQLNPLQAIFLFQMQHE
uniref:Uncharacterized protein n=1 Tax=Timema monikensis TaxID=170555 RepID=A0A7R9HI04_9NEOP|nr:unnamed protein product [Timema monikensis]